MNVRLPELIEAAERCKICHLILRVAIDTADKEGNLSFIYTYSALRSPGGRRLLRFSTGTGKHFLN